MAADINDKFTEATNGSRPVPTTLTALLPSGASPGTATCGALTGWPTATAVHFIIYTIDVNGRKVSGSQTDWKGVVSGSTITGLVLKAGTNNGYAIGAIVEAAPTAAWADDLTEGLMVEHKQDGTHENVTADSVISTGAVSGTTITGTSVISTGDIQHRSVSLETIRSEITYNFVASGCVWTGDAYASTLNASMTAGIVYIDGQRVSVSSISARGFTASKDTYIDVGIDGVVEYTEVANNAASPALAASHIRLGIIVSGGSNIASVAAINQGQTNKILPIASNIAYTVCDSLGNLICNRKPNPTLLAFRKQSAAQSGVTTIATITGQTAVILLTETRTIKLTVFNNSVSTVANDRSGLHVWANGAEVSVAYNKHTSTDSSQISIIGYVTLAAGTYTCLGRISRISGTGTISSDQSVSFLSVELV